jgi:hypothetical protein
LQARQELRQAPWHTCRQLQRGIQALQEDRSHLKAKVETLETRVQLLESSVVSSSQQAVALQAHLVKALTEGKSASVEDLAAVSLPPPFDMSAKHLLFQRPSIHKADQPGAPVAGAGPAAAREEGAAMARPTQDILLGAGTSNPVAGETAAGGTLIRCSARMTVVDACCLTLLPPL